MPQFDKSYWEEHWATRPDPEPRTLPTNPYLPLETTGLQPTTVLDAGCGTGAEALWLAEHGWQVTAADISATALATARARAIASDLAGVVDWVEVDLSRWAPARTWDLVVTSYAHSELGQLEFYRRISSWVAQGGTLLIVGHLHDHGHHEQQHPVHATASRAAITGLFADADWRIESDYESTRAVHPDGKALRLHDVVVRARRVS